VADKSHNAAPPCVVSAVSDLAQGDNGSCLERTAEGSDTEDIDDLNEDPPTRRESEEEKRRFAKGVMAGSVAPRSAGWLFHYGPFDSNPRRARRIILVVVVVEALGLGLFGWALSSGDNGVVLHCLLAVAGLAVITFPIRLAVNMHRSRRRRSSKNR
jgi:hypothetical protein